MPHDGTTLLCHIWRMAFQKPGKQEGTSEQCELCLNRQVDSTAKMLSTPTSPKGQGASAWSGCLSKTSWKQRQHSPLVKENDSG